MTFREVLAAVSFERVYKVVVMLGATISAVSFVAIALMLAPTRPSPNLADDADGLQWTTTVVPVSPERRARIARAEPERRPEPAPPAPARADAAQPAAAPTPTPEATPAVATEAPASAPESLAAPAQAAPAQSAREPAREEARTIAYDSPEVIDGGTLWVDGRVIRLAGIEPLGRDDVCERGRRVWRCGRQAVATLRNLVRRQRVECTPVGGDARLARCTVDGKDLSAFLIAQRLAIPAGAADVEPEERPRSRRELSRFPPEEPPFRPPPFRPYGMR